MTEDTITRASLTQRMESEQTHRWTGLHTMQSAIHKSLDTHRD